MPKYIDATRMLIEENEAYLSAHSKITDELTRKVNYVIHTKLQQLLSDAPAEDVVPITRGRWLTWEEKFPEKEAPNKNNLGVFCTACGLHADNRFMYCPSCGAKMENGLPF